VPSSCANGNGTRRQQKPRPAPCVSDGATRERAKQVRAREWLGASDGRTAGGYKAVSITSTHPQGMSARALFSRMPMPPPDSGT
jgi:hypothetical protein